MHLVLFDIDGTLLDCGRQVRPLLASALEEVFGTAGDIDAYDFAGKTDPRIVLDLMGGAGVSPERVLAGLAQARAAYLERLERGLDRERMRLLPEVETLLGRLAERRDVVLGLLTGNWHAGARIKLGRLGLNRFFAMGAFGDDAFDRNELPPIALRRARELFGYPFAFAETLIIGDSLLDVACAQAHGVAVLAVATGWTSAELLTQAGADWVIPDLGAAHLCPPLCSAP